MLLESIKGWQSGEERTTLVNQMYEGKMNRIKQGSVMVAQRAPYGYKLVKHDRLFRLEIDPQEAEIVKLIFRWYTIGDEDDPPLSLNGIVRNLSTMGIPNPAETQARKRNRNKQQPRSVWGRSTVHRMLNSEVYIGTWYYRKTIRGKDGKLRKNKGEQIPVSVPAILDNRTWELAQIRIKDNRGKLRPNKYKYLLSQRVTCGCCNYKVVGTSSTVRKDGSKPLYYRCPSKVVFDHNRPCDLPCFSVDKVDTAVWNWIRGLFENEELLEAAIRRYLERGEEEIAPLRERLEGINVLISEKEEELAQAQQFYRSIKESKADRTKASLLAEIENTEKFLDSLENRRKGVEDKLSQTLLSEAEIQTIHNYAAEGRQGLDISNASFEQRRWFVEKSDVKATLTVEDKQRIAYVECWLSGEEPERLEIEDDTLLSHTS